MVARLRFTTSVSEVREPMDVGAAVVHADRSALDSVWVAPTVYLYILLFAEMLFINQPQVLLVNCKERHWELCILYFGLGIHSL
jgi:hypothetical protein